MLAMKKLSAAIRLSALTQCCAVASLVIPALAIAQVENATIEEVMVVGSQIKGVDVTGTMPVTQLGKDDIDLTGAVDGDELLRSIPQIGSVGFGASRGGITGVNAARGDVGSVNLRSMGEGNTLVLINGRRMVLHPISQTSSIDGTPIMTANSNTIPVAGIERVEVLRDGAGAIYGSDAVAGVVNYTLQKDYDGGELTINLGAEEGVSRDDAEISGAKGFEFNEGRTYLTVSGSYAKKNGILASENGFSSNQDLRGFAPAEFASDNSLDQRSSLEPLPSLSYNGLGSFHLRPVDLVRDNGSSWSLADCGGRGVSAGGSVINDGLQDLCLDSSGQDRAIRPNRNETRTLVPDVERINLFSYLSHELENDMELYGEASYYRSTTKRRWEQASILSNGRFFVPADYYWNPLGPVRFADGRLNPNRLAGLDPNVVPEEGLGFRLLSLRPVDVGTRNIEVEGSSYRFLTGLKGSWNNWDWDTAVLYSEAKVEDTAYNRISTPLLQAQLSLDTEDAYNIFTGVNPANPTSIIDSTPNPRSRIDPFIVSATREAETSLALADFKISTPELFAMPAGNAAFGAGVEWRRETLDEDNSAIFDGSQPYRDPLNASLDADEITNRSSLQGSSVRPDLSADRNVASVYAELILPLVADKPFIQNLDAQIAVRYEKFSDVGDVTRPKFALSWQVSDWLQLRGAYSEGFRAPNLVQLNSPITSITTSVDDYAEGILLGTGDINDGPANGNYIRNTVGNPNLVPEESENSSFGVVLTPTENLLLTLDWWETETLGTVGLFNDENQSRLDAVLRAQGSFNPLVVRGTPDAENPLGEIETITLQYENLNTRTVEGVDLSFAYGLDSSLGGFDFKLNVARILEFDQEPGGNAQILVDAGARESVLGSSVGSQIEGEFIPKWRATTSLNWADTDDIWRAGVFASYVSKVTEPAVTNSDGEVYEVDPHHTVNTYVSYAGLFGEGSVVKLGVNNVFDREPPLAREAFGFEGELHSSRGRYVYLRAHYKF